MERSRRWLVQLIIVVVYLLSSSYLVLSLQCSNYYYSEKCTLRNLQINSSDLGSLKFPVHSYIELENVQVDYLSPQVVLRMKWVSNLTITNGEVSYIFLKNDLLELVATSSKTQDVIIVEAENKDLEKMDITHNLLRSIPKNIGFLKALTTLKLSSNRIETVDLGQLHGLDNLTHIDLSSNRIYYIVPTTTLELSRLESLSLNSNFLTEIDFDGWIVPRLRLLHIAGNSLTFVRNFNGKVFPSIEEYYDANNIFDCRWRTEFVSQLMEWTKFKNSYLSAECSKGVRLSSANYRELNISDIRKYSFDFDNKEELQKQIDSMIDTEQKHSQHIESLKSSLQDKTDKLELVSSKFLTQQSRIDELLVQVERLAREMANVKQMLLPVAPQTVTKGLREKLIHEVVDVIRKNLAEQ
ncbi:leucine-rich repeat protein SHOC-2-like [Armigeres subalbatus]|uniref:leucine-rich repeat protein SHOC-2-like n=1 Tax=Armigeres subalbatus TaxID=124917 RepID=UPI002ECFC265